MARLAGATGLILLLLVSMTSRADSACQDENFAFPRFTPEGIGLRFEGAVLRVQSGDSIGTGFLIDSNRGFVVTAAHVLFARGEGDRFISARSSTSSQLLHLVLLGHLLDEEIDLALLKLQPADALRHVIAMDVATNVPGRMTKGVILGYPWAESFSETEIQSTSVELSGGKPGYEYRGRQFTSLLSASAPTGDGISGAPLVDLNGTAIAVVVANEGAKTYFSSLSELPRLFADVELPIEMRELDSNLREGKINPEELIRRMKPERYNDSFRNLDLIGWGGNVGDNVEAYAQSAVLFRCPIQRAFQQRRIEGVALRFEDLIDAAALGSARIEHALSLALSGRQEEAAIQLQAAEHTLRTLADRETTETSELLAALESTERVIKEGLEVLPPKRDWLARPAEQAVEPGRGGVYGRPSDAVTERIVLRGVYFDFDSAQVRPDAAVILDEVAEVLAANPAISVQIAGHTDSVGSEAYNQLLSELRALSVKTHLVSRGVDPNRLDPVGFGESRPIASNDTTGGGGYAGSIPFNRRVEFVLE